MTNWINKLTGAPVSPVNAQYEALTLTVNTQLYWPIETLEGVPYVAAQIDVTASVGSLALLMPDATQSSTGNVCYVTNIGSNSFTLEDSAGGAIQVIAASQTYAITLTDNSTAAGTWRTALLGATTSNANAATLAGAGLEANGAKLQSNYAATYLSANQTITTGFRANQVIWDGAAAGTLQLDSIATLGAGWWVLVTNEGSDSLTISTTGSDTINGVASIELPVGSAGQFYSALIGCSSAGFNTFGNTPFPTAVAAGGTGATTATQALTNLGGTAIGKTIFTAPNAAAVLAALGISTTAVTEVTISSNTNVGTGAAGNAYHCTAPLTLSLVATSGLSTSFYFYVDAHGGAVTITPDAADSINGQVAGVSYTIGTGASLMMVTDGAGNWWPFTGGEGGVSGGIPWAIAGGTADVITASFTPSILALTDGLIVSMRAFAANATSTPNFSPDGLTAHTITKRGGVALVPGDIPGALFEGLYRYNLSNTRWELLNPAYPAAAIAYGGVIGEARNAAMTVAAASASGTFTAEQIAVGVSLSSMLYRLVSYSQTVNLATTGAGGMDTGTAPISGFVSLYAIYNPAGGATSILACNVTTSSGSVYSGANMPAGYTASALIGVWPTNASSQFYPGAQRGRVISPDWVRAVTFGTGSHTLDLSAVTPPSALYCSGYVAGYTASALYVAMGPYSSTQAIVLSGASTPSHPTTGTFSRMALATPQTLYVTESIGAGNNALYVSSYEF